MAANAGIRVQTGSPLITFVTSGMTSMISAAIKIE